MKLRLLLVAIAILAFSSISFAQDPMDDEADEMTMEDEAADVEAEEAAPVAPAPKVPAAEGVTELILFQDVPMIMGTLLKTKANRNPVSMTVIDSEKLRITPARNLYDILEVYVPGFQVMSHFDSHHMGLRGLIVDRDYEWILLVNGRSVNQRSHGGAITELENWDLNDIEKVEVIRGPGSVTYGPGAVAGVISITTKNADTAPGTQIGTQYVSNYGSLGGYVSQALSTENLSFFLYGSITQTQGYENPDILAFANPSVEGGFADGSGGNISAARNPDDQVMTYYKDAREQPQLKLYTELDFLKEFKFWARYTNSGTTRFTTWLDHPGWNNFWFRKKAVPDGGFEDNPATKMQQAEAVLKNSHTFSDQMELKTMISAMSVDCKRVDLGFWQKTNFVENYSESNLLLQTMLRYTPMETLKTALGYEYSYDRLGMGWGETDEDAFIIDDGVLFLSNYDSPASTERSWISARVPRTSYDMSNYAFFTEISYSLTEAFDVMVAGRLDKHRFSEMVLSPRLAFVYDAANAGIYKLSLQRSVRENTLVQLAAQEHFNNLSGDQEIFNGLELMYSNSFGAISLDFAAFYSEADLLGWNAEGGENAPQRRTTSPVGEIKIGGFELDLLYKSEDEKIAAGLNHAFARQFDFSLAEGESGSYISISDIDKNDDFGTPKTSVGNDRMNWANNVTKFHATLKFMDNKLTIFNSMRVIWGYEGNKNWLEMYDKGAEQTTNEAFIKANTQFLRDHGIFDTDFRFDLSASYEVLEGLAVTAFGQNLIKVTKNWRYIYIQEGGAALDEPTVVGVRVGYKF